MTVELKNISLDHPDVFCALTQFQHAGYIGQTSLWDALGEAGVPHDMHPKAPTDHVCLGRAMREVAGRSDRVEPISDGWVLTSVTRERLDLEDPDNTGRDAHEVTVTAKVIRVGDTKYLRITPEDAPHAPLIHEEYSRHQGLFKAAEDVSRWLSQRIVPWAGGVAAKARGGSYYITKGEGLDRIRSVKAALDSVSLSTMRTFKVLDEPDKVIQLPTVVEGSSIILKPEFAGLDAIRIMLNGIIEEVDRTCDDLHATLTKGTVGSRGLQTKIEQAEALETKIDVCSKSLGLDLSDMKQRSNELKSGLGIALAQTTDL